MLLFHPLNQQAVVKGAVFLETADYQLHQALQFLVLEILSPLLQLF